jgi:hypothetical protein
MVRGGATATADDVDEGRVKEGLDGVGEVGGGKGVAALVVREAGVGVSGGEEGCMVGEGMEELDVLGGWAGGAIESDGEEIGVLSGGEEGEEGLRGEGAPVGRSERSGEHDGEGVSELSGAVSSAECGFGVEGIEDGLDEEDVCTGACEGEDLGEVGVEEFVEGDGAAGGVIGVRGQGGGLGGRADGGGKEDVAVWV